MARCRLASRLAAVLLPVLLGATPAQHSQVKRVVIVKVDGLPAALVQSLMAERDEQTGKSVLPWMDEVFAKHGVRIQNFYVRGISLSAPSWSMLDTGAHLQIRGNVEYDRYTLRVYDYLNFFPFYLSYALKHEVDMPGVDVLDELGIPLLIDRFPVQDVLQGFQLFQRGVRWQSLKHSLMRPFKSRSPKQLFDEWQTGFQMEHAVGDQMEHELITHLADPDMRYLDYFTGDFDHLAHLTNDAASQRHEVQQVDALIGRIWTAIQTSSLGPETALFLVSDHGMNSDERIYSQGYNLIDLLGSAAGGGHHVVTNRYPMQNYKVRGLDPLVSHVVSPSEHSYYLQDQSTQYPTALLDLDGNERANVYLRNSDLNVLQLLLQQIARQETPPAVRAAALRAALAVIEEHRKTWEAELDELNDELAAIQDTIKARQPVVAAMPRRRELTKAQRNARLAQQRRRLAFQLDSWENERRRYLGYMHVLSNLVHQTPKTLAGGRFKMEDLIPSRAMGDPNTLGELQNYVISVAPGGLHLTPDGSLDMQASFRRLNYFSLLRGISVRNTVQPGVSPHPIDFVAVRIPASIAAKSFPDEPQPLDDAVWVYQGEAQQLVILSRAAAGTRQYRCLPVASLHQDSDGLLRFTPMAWRDDLPLRLFEDPDLAVPGDRTAWLSAWHPERDWFRAIHKTEYSNGVIGLYEELARNDDRPPQSNPVRRYAFHKRMLAASDMLVLASNHWNFNVRGFNPGGNHGSFFRISTHAVLMLAGGRGSGIPQGLTVEEPYDSLSFVPTVLAALGRGEEAAKLPGPVIREALPAEAAP